MPTRIPTSKRSAKALCDLSRKGLRVFDQSYKAIFERRAESYHRAMTDCPGARQCEFQNIVDLADIREGEIVCDIPSGGCYLREFVGTRAKIISVETSIEFLKFGRSGDFHQRVLCRDLDRLPLKDGAADKVISLAALHHVSDKGAFFREAYRCLARNGVLAVADVRKNSKAADFLNGFVDRHNSMGHRGEFIDETAADRLRQAGFRVEYSEAKSHPWIFESSKRMASYCRLLFGLDQAGSDEEILRGLREGPGYEQFGDQWFLNWELLFIKATKD